MLQPHWLIPFHGCDETQAAGEAMGQGTEGGTESPEPKHLKMESAVQESSEAELPEWTFRMRPQPGHTLTVALRGALSKGPA